MNYTTIGIVGTGAMGQGIAMLTINAGFKVIIFDVDSGMLEKAYDTIEKHIKTNSFSETNTIIRNLTLAYKIEGLKDSDFVIEAVSEDIEIKKRLFASLEKICFNETIFATNTSSLSITEIASALERKERFVGLHFFNPPHKMPLVEITKGYYTADSTVEYVTKLARVMDKKPVIVQKDSPGFIVNRILAAQFIEAIKILEEGVASKEDIDYATTVGLNYPMGPFALQDMIGLDILGNSFECFYKELDSVRWQVPQAFKILLKAGRFGKKKGAGWYDY